MLVEFLPPEGALNTAIRNRTPEEQLDASAGDPAQAPWSTVETLLASLIDEIRHQSWMYASVNSKSGNIRRPEPIRRPGGTKRRGRKILRMSDVRALDPRMRDMSDNEIRKLMNSPSFLEVPDD